MSQHLDGRASGSDITLSDDSVQDMLALAERLRSSSGGTLDDATILAVAEATGAPTEYVRLALRMRQSPQKEGLGDRVRTSFLALEPDTRRHVISGIAATSLGLCVSLQAATQDQYGIYGIVSILLVTTALYNAGVCRESKTAAITGALFGGLFFVFNALFHAVFRVAGGIESLTLIPYTLFGALAGLVLQKIVDQYRGRLGLTDPAKERQDLLRQLVEIQDRLRSGEQTITFVSIDIVGSTRMKQMADPLSVEFTFTEYHNFVEMIARRYNGRIHSTAGDGITLAFDHPQQAFAAARTIQTGLIELNTFRNKIGMPIVLRCGIHTGTVMAPDATDVTSINFASVLDIAAHLQKACPPGGIAVSEVAARQIPGGERSVGETRIDIDSASAIVWAPRSLPAAVGQDQPPSITAEPA